ncbi:uncharacterized protein LOC132195667 isoform X2 [Neocloeon triangulifer]|uniref:uncharacterized protein LOC132195667 isoform X2 n=1 Tax=Neocloeon triangulifer TaxID=2078957 RepID=UPI00286EC583|nr:uncharacterized protein LOC132195667 isoform X2 [Neocloeon triangulifer]
MGEKVVSYLWMLACILIATAGARDFDWNEAANEELSFTDCWTRSNPSKKSGFPKPVFNFEKENLSFKGCGNWYGKNDGKLAPWHVLLYRRFCPGVVLSDRTIITTNGNRCAYVLETFKETQEKITIFGGECADKRNEDTCYMFRGLLRQRVIIFPNHTHMVLFANLSEVIDVKKVVINIGSFYSQSIYLWEVDISLKFTPSLQPACLWNSGNENDHVTEKFYHTNVKVVKPNSRLSSDFLQEEKCFEDSTVKKWQCDLYGNSICTDFGSKITTNRGSFLFIERRGRFYLRASIGMANEINNDILAWLDLVPYLRRIVAASANLAMMPEIPDLIKKRIDFGATQSFENCGRQPRRPRSRRETDDKAPAGGFIVGGRNAVKGHHPWHASMSRETNLGVNIPDFCGATLVTKTTLVTAAHCLVGNDGPRYNISELYVTLGMHSSLSENENSRQYFAVLDIVVHPNYTGGFINDIALIELDDEVEVTEFVRPICLWNSDHDLDKITNRTGTVVGWGHTSNQTYSDILQRAELKIVSYEECYDSKKLFFSVHLKPRGNFCAGFIHNNTGACKGDSGGGFSLYDREPDLHFLRGVVSLGRLRDVPWSSEKSCDPKFYALYTDVTTYMQWIVENSPGINKKSPLS